MLDVTLLRFSLLFITSACASSSLNTFIDAITNTLTFTLRNYELIDTNLLFGVAIVAGQLEVIAEYDSNDDFQSEIYGLRVLCESIYENGFNENTTKINIHKTPKLLFSQKLWAFDNLPTRLTMPDKFLSDSGVSASSSYSIWVEDEFQFRRIYENCLRILLQHCHVPRECFQWIIDFKSKEYILTHQILYLQIMKQTIQKNLCTVQSISLTANDLDRMMHEKCSEVYVEVQEIEKEIGFSRSRTLIDLLLEQVVVCGLQNYVEFFSERYFDLILADEFQLITDLLKKSVNESHITNAVHLMSVRVAAQILYLKVFYSSILYEEAENVL